MSSNSLLLSISGVAIKGSKNSVSSRTRLFMRKVTSVIAVPLLLKKYF